MVTITGMTEHYRKAFSEDQAKVLAEATVLIEADLVRREDFSKLTATVERLPKLLAKHYGFVESSALPEVFRRPDGTADEIDVVLRGEITGRPVVFLCEVKSNVTPREVADFKVVVERVRPVAACDDVRMIFFGYLAGSEARDAIAAAGGYLALPHAVIVAPS